nr:MAG: zinc-binding loop region of homing endonuclease [Bacteriophage sp.]
MEHWKWIKGYEGKYEVSDLGRIRSYATGKIRYLSAKRVTRDGYIHVSLRKDNKAHEFRVNRLVAEAFIGDSPKGKETVNHINGVKTDNRAVNLEWASMSDQMYHAYAHKLKKPRQSKHKTVDEFTLKEKEDIWNNYEPYKQGHSIHYFALKYNVHHTVIEKTLDEKNV